MSLINNKTRMSTHSEFNKMACEFADDLQSTFDEYSILEVVSTSLSKMVESDESTPLPVTMFYNVTKDFEEQIKQKDATLLDLLDPIKLTLGVDIDFKGEYASCDEDTQSAIWDYIQGLFAMAKSLASSGKVDGVDIFNPASLMSSFSEMNPENLEAMMNSVMTIVPPGLKDFVDLKVQDCQNQIESGDVTAEELVQNMMQSMGGLGDLGDLSKFLQ